MNVEDEVLMGLPDDTPIETDMLILEIMEDLWNSQVLRLQKAEKRVDICGCISCQHELRNEFDRADYLLHKGIWADDARLLPESKEKKKR